MKISMIQMDMGFADPKSNKKKAEELIWQAASEGADLCILPETWNVGFFPREGLEELADEDGRETEALMSRLAAEYQVNIAAGSVAVRDSSTGEIRNRAMVFDRKGRRVALYDKAHLFTNMQEHEYFKAGDEICVFEIDGICCGLVICYDIRFTEWLRKTAAAGISLLLVSAQWPDRRLSHWQILNRARAIENQIFVAAVNSCGRAGEVKYAGHSMIIDPLGEVLREGGDGEEIIDTEISFQNLAALREQIPVWRDRRTEIY